MAQNRAARLALVCTKRANMNNMNIEQVEYTKLIGVTLDYKLSWSKHINATVAKMGRSLSIIKCCSALTTLSTRQVLQALVSTFLRTLSTRTD